MIINLFRSSKLEIDIGGTNWILISARCHKLAKKLQQVLNTHQDYSFKLGDEAMFKVPSHKLPMALEALGLPRDLQQRIENSFKNAPQINCSGAGLTSLKH